MADLIKVMKHLAFSNNIAQEDKPCLTVCSVFPECKAAAARPTLLHQVIELFLPSGEPSHKQARLLTQVKPVLSGHWIALPCQPAPLSLSFTVYASAIY